MVGFNIQLFPKFMDLTQSIVCVCVRADQDIAQHGSHWTQIRTWGKSGSVYAG